MKYSLVTFLILFLVGVSFSSCEEKDPRTASPIYTNLSDLYDFFNAVRFGVAELENDSPYLTNFMSDTKKFLENKKAQTTYQIAGLYFEKGLNRQKGAYEYADRFYPEGCVVHVVVLPASAEERWKVLLGVDKGKGKQVGPNFIYYQVFTAQPTDAALEEKVTEIIEREISNYAAVLGKPLEN